MNEIELREAARALVIEILTTGQEVHEAIDADPQVSDEDAERLHALICMAQIEVDFPTPPGMSIVRQELLMSLVDTDPCSFDHHGGCQAHGYLSLQPGELCPQAELQDLINRPIP